MKKTATEYLFEKLWETPKDKLTWQSILEQANKMFETQIRNAFWDGCANWDNEQQTADKYYKETYDK
jgi:hypothetical protein